jgi:hypothetical protein
LLFLSTQKHPTFRDEKKDRHFGPGRGGGCLLGQSCTICFEDYSEAVKSSIGDQIRMFLGLPDPDPLVRGTDPDLVPDRIRLRILPFSHRCAELTEIVPAK